LFIVHSKDNERQFEKTKPISGCLSRKKAVRTEILCI
jgi:hypothetical protein